MNRIFIICAMDYPYWKMPCANAERHVATTKFHLERTGEGGRYQVVTPRLVLDGKEGMLKKYFKLRRALRSCSAVYYVKGFSQDRLACRLFKIARRRKMNDGFCKKLY